MLCKFQSARARKINDALVQLSLPSHISKETFTPSMLYTNKSIDNGWLHTAITLCCYVRLPIELSNFRIPGEATALFEDMSFKLDSRRLGL